MSKISESTQRKSSLIATATELVQRGLNTKEEKAQYDKLLKEIDSEQELLDMLLRTENFAESQPKPVPVPVVAAAPESKEQRRAKLNGAWRSYLKGENNHNYYDAEIRDILSNTSGGGALVPVEFQSEFLSEALKWFAPLTQYIRTRFSSNGRAVQVGSVDDRANGLLYIPEDGSSTVVPEVDPTSFSSAYVSTSTLSTGTVKYSVQLLDDSGFDLVELLKRLASSRIGRGLEKALTRGVDSAGTSIPNNPGIVNIAQTGVTTTQLISGVSFNNLWDIFEALDVSYLPRAVWMMTSQMRNVLAKSQDSTGRSLLVPSPTIAGVDMLLQKPIVINNSLDLPGTANGVPIVFGSLYDGVEMVSSEVRVQNLTQRYADQLLNALITTTRVGSTALAPGALQKLVLAAS